MRIIQVSRSTRLYPTIVLSKIQNLLIILYLLMVLNHHYCLFALQTMSSISISHQVPRKSCHTNQQNEQQFPSCFTCAKHYHHNLHEQSHPRRNRNKFQKRNVPPILIAQSTLSNSCKIVFAKNIFFSHTKQGKRKLFYKTNTK